MAALLAPVKTMEQRSPRPGPMCGERGGGIVGRGRGECSPRAAGQVGETPRTSRINPPMALVRVRVAIPDGCAHPYSSDCVALALGALPRRRPHTTARSALVTPAPGLHAPRPLATDVCAQMSPARLAGAGVARARRHRAAGLAPESLFNAGRAVRGRWVYTPPGRLAGVSGGGGRGWVSTPPGAPPLQTAPWWAGGRGWVSTPPGAPLTEATRPRKRDSRHGGAASSTASAS